MDQRWVLQRSQHFLTSFEPDDVVTAITRNNVINKISIMLSVVGKWIKNRRLTSELVEFLEFVSTVGIYNQKIIRRSVKMALHPTEVWATAKLVSYSSGLWTY